MPTQKRKPDDFRFLYRNLNQSTNEDKEKKHWQYILQIRLHPAANLQTLTSIGFLEVIVKAPTPAGSTKNQINQSSGRQKYIADQEIFHSHDVLPADGKTAEQIKTENTGQRQDGDEYGVDEAGLLSGAVPLVDTAGDNILKDGQNRGKGCKGHQQEKQRTPETAQGHGVEHIRQCDENQVWAAIRVNAKGETGWEDNQSGGNCNESVENNNLQ